MSTTMSTHPIGRNAFATPPACPTEVGVNSGREKTNEPQIEA
jgi:hypothetical protein